ncbi:MAG: nucleoid-associated protein [Bacteroidetes bacterium]|nr:nucleoid-associated protein [Bacteroidota bacterium]
MLDFTNTIIDKVSVHHIGNITNEEALTISDNVLDTSDEKLKELLTQFFLTPFTNPEYFSFTSGNDDFTENPVFNIASDFFDDVESFHGNTIQVAKHLYNTSTHPQIKAGDLFVAYFNNVSIDGELTDAIGIFKSETRHAFLKLNDFILGADEGINPEKLDKGCLIFNMERDSGFKVCIVDKSNKTEAAFWRDAFLNLTPCHDDFHYTKEFMNITKKFVTDQFTEDFEATKTEQIDLLNRSVAYFKDHTTFDKDDFEQEVFRDSEVIESFRNFDNSYREDNAITLNDNFDISPTAVKKQQKIFKSILKLDKNFHIYIHGDKDKIEQGTDTDGRKFYKIYYDKEE